jgi:hypothetical protein
MIAAWMNAEDMMRTLISGSFYRPDISSKARRRAQARQAIAID